MTSEKLTLCELKHTERISKVIKNDLNALITSVFLLATTGCTSVNAYLADRGHDTMDVITVTSGVGMGAKAKAGPFASGLCLIGDLAGLRGGELFASAHAKAYSLWSPIPLNFIETGSIGGVEKWNATVPDSRHKDYDAGTRWPLLVSDFYFAEGDACHHDNENAWSRPYPYQIELGVGLGLSAQIGVNPAECLDLALGFIGIDLFGDDQRQLELQKGANQATGGQLHGSRVHAKKISGTLGVFGSWREILTVKRNQHSGNQDAAGLGTPDESSQIVFRQDSQDEQDGFTGR